MNDKYISERGYFKFFNEFGTPIRIKISKHLSFPSEVMIKFKKETNDSWKYTSPNYEFKSILEVLSYIVKHANSDDTNIFKIAPLKV